MKIAIPSRGPEPGALFEPHFGHARWLLIYDTEDRAWSAAENGAPPAGGHGAGMAAARRVCALGVQAVIAGRMGPHPNEILREAGIAVKQAGGGTAEEALGRYLRGELADLPAAPKDHCRHEPGAGAGERGAPRQRA